MMRRGCPARTALNGQAKNPCPKYDTELARAWERQRLTSKVTELTNDIGRAEQHHAERRQKLKAELDNAAADLAHAGPAKVANSDALALSMYLQGLGLSVTVDRVNGWLVLLSVLAIECGSGLALAVALALQNESLRTQEGYAGNTAGNAQVTQGGISVPSGVTLSQQLPQPLAFQGVPLRFKENIEAALVRILREHGGHLVAGQRTLGRSLGVSATHINRILAKLSAAGVISLDATRRGSSVRLVVAATA